MDVATLLGDQRERDTRWWRDAIRLSWSIQSEITAHGFFVIGQPGYDGWVYGVYRIVGSEVEPVTPHTHTRFVAFRRLRKLERQAR